MNDTERFIHDAYMAKAERTEKRLWMFCTILFLSLIITNAWWLYRESQYVEEETTTIEATQDGDGVNIVGGRDAVNVTESKNH